MSRPLREREWFTNAHAHLAGILSAGIIHGRVPPRAVRIFEEQLERAYKRGRADERAGRP